MLEQLELVLGGVLWAHLALHGLALSAVVSLFSPILRVGVFVVAFVFVVGLGVVQGSGARRLHVRVLTTVCVCASASCV